MNLTETTAKLFGELFQTPQHVYNSVAFCELNRHKVANMHYLLIQESKTKLGIVLGEREEGLFSPFSAPFGGFVTNHIPSLEHIDEAVKALKSHGETVGKTISITLPPPIYSPLLTNKTAHSLLRFGHLQHTDINYHFDISDFDGYENSLKLNAKQKLRTALKANFSFQHIDSDDTEGVKRAYEVIRMNREQHGYPLRMTLNDVLKTTKIITADFFLLSLNDTDVAAAQVFHASENICQVIYWGDCKGFAELRPMNALAYFLFEYYHKQGIKMLDIGPSSDHGAPSYGLCDFKESIGCTATLKHSFTL